MLTLLAGGAGPGLVTGPGSPGLLFGPGGGQGMGVGEAGEWFLTQCSHCWQAGRPWGLLLGPWGVGVVVRGRGWGAETVPDSVGLAWCRRRAP